MIFKARWLLCEWFWTFAPFGNAISCCVYEASLMDHFRSSLSAQTLSACADWQHLTLCSRTHLSSPALGSLVDSTRGPTYGSTPMSKLEVWESQYPRWWTCDQQRVGESGNIFPLSSSLWDTIDMTCWGQSPADRATRAGGVASSIMQLVLLTRLPDSPHPSLLLCGTVPPTKIASHKPSALLKSSDQDNMHI